MILYTLFFINLTSTVQPPVFFNYFSFAITPFIIKFINNFFSHSLFLAPVRSERWGRTFKNNSILIFARQISTVCTCIMFHLPV